MRPKNYELQMELNQIYDQLAEVSNQQRELNKRRDELEGDRDVILIELGRIGCWDVT